MQPAEDGSHSDQTSYFFTPAALVSERTLVLQAYLNRATQFEKGISTQYRPVLSSLVTN